MAVPPDFKIASLDISALTKAVVANCVVFVPTAAVGAAGIPVKVGDASSALSVFRFVKLASASAQVNGEPLEARVTIVVIRKNLHLYS